MQSFLSKVFGRKKDDRDVSPTQLSPGELLGERFEAISPNVSPSAAKFLELDPKLNNAGESSKDSGFSLFRPKSRPSSPETKSKRHDTLPQLSLAFLEPNGPLSPAADFVREADPDISVLLSDAIIGQRKLNPLEALVLIRACSQAIIARGLETLGVMHPHWYSASPDVQRRLISQFINSLNAESTTSPTSSSPTTAFESEMTFARPHDVAAVLRWGLRHLQLDGDHLGKDETWYTKFLEAEAAADYPLKAFSEQLAPHLPPAHLEVLTSTLEIFSSLAAHAEANSTSGSKLSKIFGLWLLVSQRVDSKDDFHAFYQRWERMGRMLEHLFLARIRDDSADRRMPVRLLELVRQYPYTKGLSNPMTDVKLLARPRITTIPYDALFVRLEVELPSEKRRPKHKINPLTLLADAFSLQIEGEHAEHWSIITSESKHGSSPSPLSNVFADETIRFLSMVPGTDGGEVPVKSPTLSIFAGGVLSPHKRSATAIEKGKGKPAPTVVSGHVKPATDPTPVSALSPLDLTQDWDQFSTSGFFEVSPAIVPLASTLFDNDVEKTIPPDPPVAVSLSRSISRRSSKSKRSRHAQSPSTTSPRKSEETIRPTPTEGSSAAPAPSPPQQDTLPLTKATQVQIIQIDEAFVDFWSDALLDPISSDWPTFIICKFKSSLVPKLVIGVPQEGQTAKTLKWLILEHVHTVKPPLPPAPVEVARPRASSPSSESMSPKKRFSFWSMNRSLSGSSVGSQKGKNKAKSLVGVGEMGELLEEGSSGSSNSKSPISRIRKSLDISRKPAESPTLKKAESMAVIKEAAPVALAAGVAVAGVAAAVALDEESKDDNQPPVTQETPEEAKPEELAEQRPAPSDAQPVLAQDENAVVTASSDAVIEQVTENQPEAEAPVANVSDPLPEVSNVSQVAEKDQGVINDLGVSAITTETSQPEQVQDQNSTVAEIESAVHEDVVESPAPSVEAQSASELEQRSSAEIAPQEAIQPEAEVELPSEAAQQPEPDSHDSTNEESQVDATQDEPSVIQEEAEEIPSVEHAVPSNYEEAAAVHEEQSFSTPLPDSAIAQTVEEAEETSASPDVTPVDDGLKVDTVEKNVETSHEHDGTTPIEEHDADVAATEQLALAASDEPTPPQNLEDQADTVIPAETSITEGSAPPVVPELEATAAQQSVEENEIVAEQLSAESETLDVPHADVAPSPQESGSDATPAEQPEELSALEAVTQPEGVEVCGIVDDNAKIVNEQESFDNVPPAKEVEDPFDTQPEPTEDIQITSEENKADDQPSSTAETVEASKPLVVEGESAPLENDDSPPLEHEGIVDSIQATTDSVPELPEEIPQPQIEGMHQVITADVVVPTNSAEPAPTSNIDTGAVVEPQDVETEPVVVEDLSAEPASEAAPQVDAVEQPIVAEQDSLVTEQPEEANTVNEPEAALVQDAEIIGPASNAELTNEEHLSVASEGNDTPEVVSPECSGDDQHGPDEQLVEYAPAIEATENVVAPSSEVHDDKSFTEKDVDILADKSGTSADVALDEPTPPRAEIQEVSVVDHETPINVVQEVDTAEIADANKPSSIEAITEIMAETPPSEQPQESSDVGTLEKVQVKSDVDDLESIPAPVTALDDVQNDSVEQIMSPPLEKENVNDHEDVSPPVPNTEPAVAVSLNGTAPSSEDVPPNHELGADAVAEITAPRSEAIVGGIPVEEDKTVVGQEATQAQPIESPDSTILEETPQQVVAQEDTGADNEIEVTEVPFVNSIEQGETLLEPALPEDVAQRSHQTSVEPDVLEKHEGQGNITTSQGDQTENVHGRPPAELSPEEPKSDDLVEQTTVTQTAEPEPASHNDQLELSNADPAVEPVIDEQLTEDQGVAEVNADSTNKPVANVSAISEAADESSYSEGKEIVEAVDPIEPPDSAAVDEPAPQIPEQREPVIDEASNEVVTSESTPVEGARGIESASESQQTEGGALVVQESPAEPTIEDDSEVATQPHEPSEQDITRDEQHEEAITIDSQSHAELANIEEQITPATTTDNNEDTLNSQGISEDVQIQETLPANENKAEIQSPIIPDTVDETKPAVEEESAPTHTNIFPDPKRETTSQLIQDTTAEPAASAPSDEIFQDQVQEIEQGTAADKETSDDVATPSATPIAETTNVTEAQVEVTRPSVEPATEGSPQDDTEQEIPEEYDQGAPPIEQPEASAADVAEVPQAESTETHGPDNAVSVTEEPQSATPVTEPIEAALDSQESSEEVQYIEMSTSEKDEDATHSAVISETLDKVKPVIEEESAPNQNDQADAVSGPEPEHVPIEGDGPSSAVGPVDSVEDTLPTPEQIGGVETAVSTLSDEVKEETELKEEIEPKEGAEPKEGTEVKETELEETEIKETGPPVTSEASAIEASATVHDIVPVPEHEELVESTPAIPEASPVVEEALQPTAQAPKDADLDEPALNGQVEAEDAPDVHKASEEQVLQLEEAPQLESIEQPDVNNNNDSQADIIQDAIEPVQPIVPADQPSEPDVEGQSVQVKDDQEVLPTDAPLSEAAEGLASSTQPLNHDAEQPETSTDDQAVNGSRSEPSVTEKADTDDVSRLTAAVEEVAVEEVPNSKSVVDIPVGSDKLSNQPTTTQAVEEEVAPDSPEVLAEVPTKGESDVLDQEPQDAVEDKNNDNVTENAGSSCVEEPTQANGDMPAEPIPSPFDASQEPLPGPIESFGIKSEGDAETSTIAAGHPALAEEPVDTEDGVKDSSAIDNTEADAVTPSLHEVPEAPVTVLKKQETKGNTDADVLQAPIHYTEGPIATNDDAGISEEAKLEGDPSKAIAEP